MTEREIMRRTRNYPPEILHHLGLITQEEVWTIWKFETYPQHYWKVVTYG